MFLQTPTELLNMQAILCLIHASCPFETLRAAPVRKHLQEQILMIVPAPTEVKINFHLTLV